MIVYWKLRIGLDLFILNVKHVLSTFLGHLFALMLLDYGLPGLTRSIFDLFPDQLATARTHMHFSNVCVSLLSQYVS